MSPPFGITWDEEFPKLTQAGSISWIPAAMLLPLAVRGRMFPGARSNISRGSIAARPAGGRRQDLQRCRCAHRCNLCWLRGRLYRHLREMGNYYHRSDTPACAAGIRGGTIRRNNLREHALGRPSRQSAGARDVGLQRTEAQMPKAARSSSAKRARKLMAPKHRIFALETS